MTEHGPGRTRTVPAGGGRLYNLECVHMKAVHDLRNPASDNWICPRQADRILPCGRTLPDARPHRTRLKPQASAPKSAGNCPGWTRRGTRETTCARTLLLYDSSILGMILATRPLSVFERNH